MSRLLSLAFLLALGLGPVPPAGALDAPPPLLMGLRDDLAAGLQDMNRAAEAAARAVELATGGEEEVRQILGLVATHDPSVIDCGWIDSGGVLRWVEPAEWRGREGTDLSGGETLRQLHRSGKPALGAVARGPEEVDASELTYPVLASGGRPAGAIRMLFRPGPFLDRIVAKRAANSGWRVWIVQADGKILFADDAQLIGRSLVSDAPFRSSPGFLDLGRRIVTESAGAALHPDPVAATVNRPFGEAYWTTVTMNGAAWRVLVMRDGGS
jgi:hypothetical protein